VSPSSSARRRPYPRGPNKTKSRPIDPRRVSIASSGKKKTTFAKLTRENRVRERRLEKLAKKRERKLAAENQPTPSDDTAGTGATDQARSPDSAR
jgi:hypothetical protein